MERLKSIFKDEMRIPPVGDESLQGPAFGSDGNLAQMWTHFGKNPSSAADALAPDNNVTVPS